METEHGFSPGDSTDSTVSTLTDERRALLAQVRDGAWLDRQTFPPLQYAVDGLIPEGAMILIGPPKVGKSYLLGGLLLAVAGGGYALGKIPLHSTRPVLYLALEDGDRRMQSRCREILNGDPIPAAFHYITHVQPRQVLATIEAFLAEHPHTALVVLDTLGKVMPEARPGESAYQRDYRVAGQIKQLADAHPGVSIVVVHHDRKATSEDFVDSVSGTNGLAGAMDTIAVLVRKRQSNDGVLKITGRDVAEAEYALTVARGQWSLDGDDLDAAAVAARLRDQSDNLGDRSTQIVRIVNDHPDGIGPTALGAKLGVEAKHAGEYLRRLYDAGRIGKTTRGKYTPVETVESVESAGGDLIPFPHSTVETVENERPVPAGSEQDGNRSEQVDGAAPQVTTYRIPNKGTVEYNADGWPDKKCFSVLDRKRSGLPLCDATVMWKVEQKRNGYVQTGYYCDADLPDEYRPEGA